MFKRLYPFEEINPQNVTLDQLVVNMAKKIENGAMNLQDVAYFFTTHELIFFNPETKMYSGNFFEPGFKNELLEFRTFRSCSCDCGPLSEPCNMLGPGSK